MPSHSNKQARFFAACAHGADYPSCPDKKVAKEFNKADAKTGKLKRAMREGKMSELALSIEEKIGPAIEHYKKVGGAEALAAQIDKIVPAIAKECGCTSNEARKLINDFVDGEIEEGLEENVTESTLLSRLSKTAFRRAQGKDETPESIEKRAKNKEEAARTIKAVLPRQGKIPAKFQSATLEKNAERLHKVAAGSSKLLGSKTRKVVTAGIEPEGEMMREGKKENREHEYSMDAAQRAMDAREAEGEDMSDAYIDPKTYEIKFTKKANETLTFKEFLVLEADTPTSVPKTTAAKVYHRDYEKTKKKKYRKYAPSAETK